MFVSFPVSVHLANAAEAVRLAALAHQTFSEAFAHTVSPESMRAYLASAFTPGQVASEIADLQTVFFLAECESKPVGYLKLYFGDALPNVCGPHPVKLWRLYTLGSWQSRGVGALLLSKAAVHAREHGGQTLWLTVNQGNLRAIAFYERNGFVKTGQTLFNLGGEMHHDWVMEKPL